MGEGDFLKYEQNAIIDTGKVIKHTRYAHELVKEGLPKQRLSEFPEVSAQHGAHRVDVVPVDQGGEGVTALLKLLLVLVDVGLEKMDTDFLVVDIFPHLHEPPRF